MIVSMGWIAAIAATMVVVVVTTACHKTCSFSVARCWIRSPDRNKDRGARSRGDHRVACFEGGPYRGGSGHGHKMSPGRVLLPLRCRSLCPHAVPYQRVLG